MSKSVQIRDVPDEVHRVLRERAARAGLSLSDYLKEEMRRLAEHPPVADVLARAGSRSGGASSERIRAAVRRSRDPLARLERAGVVVPAEDPDAALHEPIPARRLTSDVLDDHRGER